MKFVQEVPGPSQDAFDALSDQLTQFMPKVWSYYNNNAWSGSYTAQSDSAVILFINNYAAVEARCGIYLLTLSLYPCCVAIKQAEGVTVSVSGRTVTVVTTEPYIGVNLYTV